MKNKNIESFVGKYVRIYVRGGGYHEGILYKDSTFIYGSGFYMKEHIDCYISKSQRQSRHCNIPCYFQSDRIKWIKEVNTNGDSN